MKTLQYEEGVMEASSAFQVVLNAGANVNAATRKRRTLLMLAAHYRSLELIQQLVGVGANVNAEDDNGMTPLLFAAEGGRFDVMKYLVEMGAEVNAMACDETTALLHAISWSNLDGAYFLVQSGADVTKGKMYGQSAITAAASRDLQFVKCIVEAGADINILDNEGRTALMNAAASNKADVLRYLVEAGADVNLPDSRGSTALVKAARSMSIGGIRFLVEAGADINAADADGQTALLLAVYRNSSDVVRYLLEKGSSVHMMGRDFGTPLTVAARSRDVSYVRLLIEFGADVDGVDRYSRTPLMNAVMSEHNEDVISCLIEAGANVNAKDEDGRTAVIYATDRYSRNKHGAIEQLCNIGANINAAMQNGRTALMNAAESGNFELSRFLVENGADVNQCDARGHTALYFAAKSGHLAVQNFLSRHIGRYDTSVEQADELPSTLRWSLKSWFISPYEVFPLTEIGTSEFKAKWLDADVTLKLFLPGTSPRTFHDQVAVWYPLRHPNVLKLYGACNFGHHFFVCEFSRHGTLQDYLAACKDAGMPMTPWKHLHEVSMGLVYLHDRRIVHGSLQPRNIKIGDDLGAKISGFGMSGVSQLFETFGQQLWHSPEQQKSANISSKSDVYSLGLCIFEIVTGKTPWGPWDSLFGIWYERTDSTTKDSKTDEGLYELMKKMCNKNPQMRIDMTEVVYLLEKIAAAEAANIHKTESELLEVEVLLSVNDYMDGKLSRVWSKLHDLQSHTTFSTCALLLLDELENLHVCLSKTNRSWTILQRYCSLIEDFTRALQLGSDQNRILQLSSTRATATSMESFRRRIDAIDTMVNDDTRIRRTNRDLREKLREQQMEIFVSEVSRTVLTTDDLITDEDRATYLDILKKEIELHGDGYSETQMEIIREAYNTMEKQAEQTGLYTRPKWFLPWYELTIDRSEYLGDGGFGSVYRAKWLDSEVVVKQIKFEKSRDTSYASSLSTVESGSTTTHSRSEVDSLVDKQRVRHMFEQEVGIWFSLSHPNVVRLFGACHVGKPFFVCELASQGSLEKYLRDHPNEIWLKLHEASLGLQYLHARGVIHGDLKCNNIVVGSDGKAKLTDFGLSQSTEALGSADLTGAWHWVAPECLEGGSIRQSTSSDIYSLGMCIVEALRVIEASAKNKPDFYGTLPWEETDNVVVKHCVVRQRKLPRRPEVCTDDQWMLVEKMCQYEPAARLKISTVVDELAKLAKISSFEEESSPVGVTVIEDMKEHCKSQEVACSSDQHTLWQIYGLLWDRLDRLASQDNALNILSQLIKKALSDTTNIEKSNVTLIEFTKNALRGYSLHRDLDKVINANCWRRDPDGAQCHNWMAKCYEYLGVEENKQDP